MDKKPFDTRLTLFDEALAFDFIDSRVGVSRAAGRARKRVYATNMGRAL
jgi:hypothetical protein